MCFHSGKWRLFFSCPYYFVLQTLCQSFWMQTAFWKQEAFERFLKSLANDKAEDLCSAAPTQTFWQYVEVSVSSLSQWSEYFATSYRPAFVPLLFLLCFCTAFRAAMVLQPCTWKKPLCYGGKTCFSYGKHSSSCSFVLMKMQRM